MTALYSRTLERSLRRPLIAVGAGVLLTAGAVMLFMNLKREFVPADDRGFFFTFVVAPEGATVGYTDGYVAQLESILHRTKDVESTFSVIGFGGPPNSAFLGAITTDWEERERSAQEIIDEVQPQFFGVPGVFAFATNPPAFGGWLPPVQFVVQHRDFEALVKGMDALVARASTIPGLVNVDTDLRVTRPELVVSLDRDRAEDLGVPARDIATTLQTLLGGRDVARFTSENELYDVMLRLDPTDRATPSDISGLQVRGRDNSLVQLDAVTRVEERVGPRQLNHYDRVRAFTLSASLAPNLALGDALDSLNAAAAEVLPAGSTVELAGESREFKESGGALLFAFVLALVFVFMVLAAQYESLLHPFTVLLAVPLAVAGALLALWITKSTLNVYSQIGMILLIGLVSKNSILLVTYANELRARGMDALEAMREAGRIRLRPILMTSVATTFGALPIALGLGAGAGARRPLGYAIVGGMVLSTLLTLYLVPAVFVLFERLRRRKAEVPVVHEPARASRELVLRSVLLLLGAAAFPAVAAAQTVPVVTLEQARQRAEQVDPRSVAGRAQLDAASWERRSAIIDLVTPRVDAGASYIRFSDPFFNFGTGNISPNATSATLNVNYNVLGTGKIAELKRARASMASAVAGERATVFRTALATDASYMSVLADRELARVAADRLKRAQEQFGVARVRVSAGDAIATDSLQLLLEVNRARLAVLRSDSALSVSRLRLGRQIGLDGPADAAAIDTMMPPELPLTEEAAAAELRTSGPELLVARASEHRADATLGVERAGYLPDILLGATTGAYDAEFFPSAFKRTQFALTVSLPVWDGGQRELAVARARAQRDVARAERQESERAAAELVAQAHHGYTTSRAAIELAQSGVAVATESYRVQGARYREGATTILDLLEAQVALTEAEAALVQSRYANRLALAQLEALLGRRICEN